MNSSARFQFGDNWTRFLALVDETRIAEAEKSLQGLLGLSSLSGKSFLDIGCGSGLFSLAALRLGASVRSFDYDPQSVSCAQELKQRYAPSKEQWRIEQGSILDESYVRSLEHFDVVYSWGVLHHTGALWKAIENAIGRLKPEGVLAIALYNDQGLRSRGWRWVKQFYNALPAVARPVYAGLFLPPLWGPPLVKDVLRGKPFHTWRSYASRRGMSPWRDLVDWVGGLPFEVASPPAVIEFCRARGLTLAKAVCTNGYGCNEYLFHKTDVIPRGR